MHLLTLLREQISGSRTKPHSHLFCGLRLPRPISAPKEGEGESRLINSSPITLKPKWMLQKWVQKQLGWVRGEFCSLSRLPSCGEARLLLRVDPIPLRWHWLQGTWLVTANPDWIRALPPKYPSPRGQISYEGLPSFSIPSLPVYFQILKERVLKMQEWLKNKSLLSKIPQAKFQVILFWKIATFFLSIG